MTSVPVGAAASWDGTIVAQVTDTVDVTDEADPHTEYVVLVTLAGSPGVTYRVHRRYREFAGLNAKLASAFPGVTLPAFPPRTLPMPSVKMSPGVVGHRTRAFAQYLAGLLSNQSYNFAANDTLRDFLDIPQYEKRRGGTGSAARARAGNSAAAAAAAAASQEDSALPSSTPVLADRVRTSLKHQGGSIGRSALGRPRGAGASPSSGGGVRSIGRAGSLKHKGGSIGRGSLRRGGRPVLPQFDTESGDRSPSSLLRIVRDGSVGDLAAFFKSMSQQDRQDLVRHSFADHNGNTVLHVASTAGNDSVLVILLAAGADPAQVNDKRQTPLHLAVRNGHSNCAMKLYLAAPNLSVNSEDSSGRTPFDYAESGSDAKLAYWLGTVSLFRAVLDKDETRAARLLAQRVDVNEVDMEGRTPLHIACHEGPLSLVKLLLKHGPNVMHRDHDETTALHVAAAAGHTDILSALLTAYTKNGPPRPRALNSSRPAGSPHGSASRSQLETPRAPQSPRPTTPRDGDRRASLNPSVARSHSTNTLPSMGRLRDMYTAFRVEPGAADDGRGAFVAPDIDVNAKQADGLTPLHMAAANAHVAVARLLLKQRNIEPDVSDAFGQTPLHLAAAAGSVKLVKALLEAKADLSRKDFTGGTAFHHAARYAKRDVLDVLNVALDKQGLDPPFAAAIRDAIDSSGRTAANYLETSLIFVAAETGELGRLRELEARQVRLASIKDEDGRTLLHAAATFGQVEALKLLLAAGCSPNDKTESFELAPLHFAASQRHTKAVVVLLEGGADVDVLDEDALSPLHYACSNVDVNTLVALLAAKADVGMSDNDGRTPLHTLAQVAIAAHKQDALDSTVRRRGRSIMEAGRKLLASARGASSPTALCFAHLLDAGADPDAKDYAGQSVRGMLAAYPELGVLLDPNSRAAVSVRKASATSRGSNTSN